MTWWEFVLVALASYRTWRIAALDTVFNRLREAIWGPLEPEEPREVYVFLQCPWCLGWWVSLAWWASWWAWPEVTVKVAVPFALSAVVGLVASNWDR